MVSCLPDTKFYIQPDTENIKWADIRGTPNQEPDPGNSTGMTRICNTHCYSFQRFLCFVGSSYVAHISDGNLD